MEAYAEETRNSEAGRVKLCTHCKWFKFAFLTPARYGRCNAPQNMKLNLVDGSMRREIEFAVNVRQYKCRGAWYE